MGKNVICLGVGLLETRCYIVYKDGERECAVIDPGGSLDKITARLNELDLTVGKILLTHGHFDHILALSELKRATGADVLIGRGDAALLTDSSLNLLSKFMPRRYNDTSADILLSDGDKFSVGGINYTVLETPGHTSGSVCYLADGDALFSGDTLFRLSVGRTDFPTSDSNQMNSSLARLRELPNELTVYPGHGENTSISYEKAHNPYFLCL